MRKVLKPFCLSAALLLVAALPASAAEVAMLRNGYEIRCERRQQQGETTRLYLSASPDSGYVEIPTAEITGFRADDTPPAPPAVPAQSASVEPSVAAASQRHGVDADLIRSVIAAESAGNARAVSPKGAQGLMQLMPGTAALLGVQDAFEPQANVDAGTRYLRELLLRYNGNMAQALAAYNAGPARVEQYRGVPPYRETHAYVARVIRDFNRKKLAGRAVSHSGAKPKAARPAARTMAHSASD